MLFRSVARQLRDGETEASLKKLITGGVAETDAEESDTDSTTDTEEETSSEE